MTRVIYLAASSHNQDLPHSSRDQRSHNLTFINWDPEWAFGNDQEVLPGITGGSVGGSWSYPRSRFHFRCSKARELMVCTSFSCHVKSVCPGHNQQNCPLNPWGNHISGPGDGLGCSRLLRSMVKPPHPSSSLPAPAWAARLSRARFLLRALES